MAKKKAATKSRKKVQTPKPEELTKEQKYYIDGNREVVSVEQICRDLKLPLDVVQGYIDELDSAPARKQSRVARSLHRPRPGVVAMTEGASMAADDMHDMGGVTQDMVNRAAASGDYERAAELKRQMKERTRGEVTRKQAQYGHCWHFIVPPGQGSILDKRKNR